MKTGNAWHNDVSPKLWGLIRNHIRSLCCYGITAQTSNAGHQIVHLCSAGCMWGLEGLIKAHALNALLLWTLKEESASCAKSLLQPQDVNPDAEWSSVFHGSRPFDPYLIPLPIRMGRAVTGSVPPPALGNLELMKVRKREGEREEGREGWICGIVWRRANEDGPILF